MSATEPASPASQPLPDPPEVRTFQFSRDGSRIVVADGGRLEVHQVEGEDAEGRPLPPTDVRDFAVFDDDVWVVTGDEPVLTRFTLAGRPVGEPLPLPPGGAGRLTACPFGSPSAIWSGGTAVEIRDDLGRLSVSEIASRYDSVISLGARRWLVCDGIDLTLRTPAGDDRLAPLFTEGRVVDGAAIFEARSVALLVTLPEGDEQSLIVLTPRGGLLQHRLRLKRIRAARFAARRGYVLLRHDDHDLILADLRFGKVLKHVHERRKVVDLEIDGGAQQIALRLLDETSGETEMLYTTYRDLMAAQSPAPIKPEPLDDEEVEDEAPRDHEAAARQSDAAYDDMEAIRRDRERRAAEALAAAAAASDVEVVAAEADHAVVEETTAQVPPEVAPPPEEPLPHPLPALVALQPRPALKLCSRPAALSLLDRYLELVGAWAERSIAAAWDTGQITFPTDGGLPFEKEVGGILGRTSGNARQHLATAEARVEELAHGLRRIRLPGGTSSPLEILVREFGLSDLATDILLVAVAPTVWGELARVYGILANDPDRPLCDELLITQILGPGRASRHAIARELDRDAPLLRWGLLRPGEGRTRPFVALHVDPIVVRRLRGDQFEDSDADDVSSVRTADCPLDELWAPRKVIREMIARLERPPREGFARVVIRGRLGSGRRTILAALAESVNRRLGIIDVSLMPRDPRQFLEGLRVELMRCVLRGWLPCVIALDETTHEDPTFRDRLRELFRSYPGPVAIRVGPDATPPLDPGYMQFDLPALGEVVRLQAWQRALGRNALRVRDAEALAARFRVGPGVVERVVARVASDLPPLPADASAEGPGDRADVATRDVTDEIEVATRQFLEVRLGTVASRVTRLASWSSVVLPPDVVDTVREFIGRIAHRRTVYERWGFDRAMSTSRGLTALFQGGPGTGKTMVAGIIARELELDLYRIDLSRIMSKWIGETEKNLAQVFDAAEDGQAIILFDEADSLFAKRTEVKSSVDRYANLEVNYLLQRLDTFDGIAILTTNFGGSIDSAFKRRLSLRLTFPFPDEEMRAELWRVHLPPEMPVRGTFDLHALARKFQLSGGYIRNAALRAAFLAAQEEMPLTQEHLERAVKLEFKELGKLAETGVLE